MMLIEQCTLEGVEEVAENIYVTTFRSSEISTLVRPGQFVNVRPGDTWDPLLRRPFSVYRVEEEKIRLIFNIVGTGTRMMSEMKPGDSFDVLGPLGTPFSHESDGYTTALLVGGGLGVAPLPILTDSIKQMKKKVITLLGARKSSQLVSDYLEDVRVSTDDGSIGHHGNVVDLLGELLKTENVETPRIFGCGPNAMLRSLSELALREEIPCEVSMEGPMGCGFGICQGCPVNLHQGERKYALMCKEGPVFDSRAIEI